MSRLILESTMYSWLFSEKDDRDGYWDQLEKLRLVRRFQILHLSPNLSSFEIHESTGYLCRSEEGIYNIHILLNSWLKDNFRDSTP